MFVVLQSSKLVEVLSNIWGTKFRIVGTAAHLPEDLGSVFYKTSLLHLQPRQMTVTVTELQRDETLLAQDPHFTPTGYGEEAQNGICSKVKWSAYLGSLLKKVSVTTSHHIYMGSIIHMVHWSYINQNIAKPLIINHIIAKLKIR